MKEFISPISTPFNLPCGTVLKNRIVKSAMTERLAHADHLPNDRHLKLYKHWANNGAALLITGNILIDKRYLESTGNIVIEKETPKAKFKEWCAKVNKNDTLLWAQLSHAGRQSSKFATRQPVSASDVQLKKMGLFAKPRSLSDSGIEDVINRFVYAASFCKKCGFTGVQFHAAHGYLISQFLSPRTNIRTDKWGGSLENRARILYQIIERTRKQVGSDFPISVKLNSADFQRGGFDDNDSRKVIKGLEARGVDLVEISGGTYEQSAMMGIGMKESTRSREAYFLEFAQEIRKTTNIPIMVTAGFRSLNASENAIRENALDLVGYARPFLIHEDFPMGFLQQRDILVEDPQLSVLDPKQKDAVEAAYYDLQIKRLSDERSLKTNYSGLRLALHLPATECKKGLRNWINRKTGNAS